MDTLIALGIGTTIGAIIFAIRIRLIIRKDEQNRKEALRQFDEFCAQLDQEHEELMKHLNLDKDKPR